MKTLEEILAELESAEKEYQNKCKQYGIEETKKKKKEENLPVEQESSQENKEDNEAK